MRQEPVAVPISVVVLPHGEGLPLPTYSTDGAAGADLYAAIAGPLVLSPLDRVLVPCGFRMALPDAYEAQVRPRSGLAVKHGVTVVNAPGTIDADYRGEVQVALINLGRDAFTLQRGDRIAQLVISPVVRGLFSLKPSLDDTTRGQSGFGSTGR